MELIQTYFPNFSEETLLQLSHYEQLLKEWNGKVNLVSRKNEDQIEAQHILHSLSIAKFIQFQPYANVLDLGTGGGLPGIPNAIVFPNVQFHLVDSIGKKVRAVQDMVEQLGLQNVTTEQVRAEQHKGDYDFVITRAVAQSESLVKWSQHLFKDYHEHSVKNGLIALKGGDLKEELQLVKKPYRTIALTDYFKEDFFETKKLIYIQMKK